LYVTLSHTVTLNHTVTLHYTVTLSLSKRDSIAYPKSHGSQEATSASFDELRMTGKYSSCPCGFAKDYLRWYINEKGRTDTRLALDFDRTIMK
jgi:hypothetical protein